MGRLHLGGEHLVARVKSIKCEISFKNIRKNSNQNKTDQKTPKNINKK